MLVLFRREWLDHEFSGKGHRTGVNLTLGAILRLHYPGLVKISDDEDAALVLVSTWEEYKLKKDVNYGDAQGLVRHDFMVKSLCPFLILHNVSVQNIILLDNMCIYLIVTVPIP